MYTHLLICSPSVSPGVSRPRRTNFLRRWATWFRVLAHLFYQRQSGQGLPALVQYCHGGNGSDLPHQLLAFPVTPPETDYTEPAKHSLKGWLSTWTQRTFCWVYSHTNMCICERTPFYVLFSNRCSKMNKEFVPSGQWGWTVCSHLQFSRTKGAATQPDRWLPSRSIRTCGPACTPPSAGESTHGVRPTATCGLLSVTAHPDVDLRLHIVCRLLKACGCRLTEKLLEGAPTEDTLVLIERQTGSGLSFLLLYWCSYLSKICSSQPVMKDVRLEALFWRISADVMCFCTMRQRFIISLRSTLGKCDSLGQPVPTRRRKKGPSHRHCTPRALSFRVFAQSLVKIWRVIKRFSDISESSAAFRLWNVNILFTILNILLTLVSTYTYSSNTLASKSQWVMENYTRNTTRENEKSSIAHNS